MSELDNCIQYDGAERIPCETINFPAFDDPENFDAVEFQEFVDRNFSSPEYERDTPSPDGRFTLRQQQKFMGKYVNMHNNFEGCLVYHGLGSGKCHGYGTRIVAADKSIVEVQDVKVGQQLMGPRGPVTVTNLGAGEGVLYNIEAEDGSSFTCNGEHILCLRSVNRFMPEVEITVERFLRIPGIFRGHFRLFRSRVEPWTGNAKGVLHTDDYDALALKAALGGMRMRTHTKSGKEWSGTVERCAGLAFTVTRLTKDRYYGFTLNPESKGLYLLASGIVTHNTCTSVVVGEAYRAFLGRDENDGKQVVIALPPAVVPQFEEELKGKLARVVLPDGTSKREIQGCSSQIVLNSRGDRPAYILNNRFGIRGLGPRAVNTGGRGGRRGGIRGENIANQVASARRAAQVNDKMRIAKNWRVITHIGLINALVKFNDSEVMMPLAKQLQKGGNMVIIDEIQNLVSETGVLYRKLLFAMRIMGRNNRVLAMSATPIYDKPFELGLTLNLLNPRVFFPVTREQFDMTFTDGSSRQLYDMCKGYVSYFSGGDPNRFPYVRHKYVHVKMGEYQEDKYFDQLVEDMRQPVGGNYDPTQLLSDDDKGRLVKTRQLVNVSFPDGIEKSDMNIPDQVRSFLNPVSLTGRHRDTTILDRFCPKLLKVAEMVDQLEMSHMVFSDLKRSGVSVIAGILKKMGYLELTVQSLKNIDVKDSRAIRALTADKGRRAFTVWSGDIPPNEKSEYSAKVRRIMGMPENFDGSLLRCVLGTTSIMEGVSFLGVRGMHIVNPWWNDSRIRQVIARAVRFNSHRNIADPEQHLVTVYKYVSMVSHFPYAHTMSEKQKRIRRIEINRETGEKELAGVVRLGQLESVSTDQYMYQITDRKKRRSSEFEMTLKRSAVDCGKNRGANKIRLEEHVTPKYERDEDSYRWYIRGYVVRYLDASTMREYMDPENNFIPAPADLPPGVDMPVPTGPEIDVARLPSDRTVVLTRVKRSDHILQEELDAAADEAQRVSDAERAAKGKKPKRLKRPERAHHMEGMEEWTFMAETIEVPTSMVISEDINCRPPDRVRDEVLETGMRHLIDQSRKYKLMGNPLADFIYPGDTVSNRERVLKLASEVYKGMDSGLRAQLKKWCVDAREARKFEDAQKRLIVGTVPGVHLSTVHEMMSYANGSMDIPEETTAAEMAMIQSVRDVLDMTLNMPKNTVIGMQKRLGKS